MGRKMTIFESRALSKRALKGESLREIQKSTVWSLGAVHLAVSEISTQSQILERRVEIALAKLRAQDPHRLLIGSTLVAAELGDVSRSAVERCFARS